MTLGNERGGRAITRYAIMAELFWHLVDEIRSHGTAEIQRNILAERVLRLPRETRGPA